MAERKNARCAYVSHRNLLSSRSHIVTSFVPTDLLTRTLSETTLLVLDREEKSIDNPGGEGEGSYDRQKRARAQRRARLTYLYYYTSFFLLSREHRIYNGRYIYVRTASLMPRAPIKTFIGFRLRSRYSSVVSLACLVTPSSPNRPVGSRIA